MHGGTNHGAPKGNRNAWKHGGRSAEAMEAACYLRAIAPLLWQKGGRPPTADNCSRTAFAPNNEKGYPQQRARRR